MATKRTVAERWNDFWKEQDDAGLWLLHKTYENDGKQGLFSRLLKKSLVRDSDDTDIDDIAEAWERHLSGKVDQWVPFWEDQSERVKPEVFDDWATSYNKEDDKAFWFHNVKESLGDASPISNTEYSFLHSLSWEKYVESRPSSVAMALQKLSPDDDSDTYASGRGIRNIKTDIDGKSGRAYYLPHGNVNFRHEGSSGKKPVEILLRDLSSTDYQSKVLVFYSASGSGKTVELAGSSVSRKAHLTLVLTPEDNGDLRHGFDEFYALFLEGKETGKEDKPKELFGRDGAALTILREEIKNLASENQDALSALLSAARSQGCPLRLVVAIDEASRCPLLVRCIIRDHKKDAVDVVRDALEEFFETSEIEVQFSVAGTGASSSTAGSLPENFEVVQPTIANNIKLRDLLLAKLPAKLLPGCGGRPVKLSESIDQHLPVAAVLMENGRMASIAAAALREQRTEIPVDEAGLVARIAASYMKSNGLNSLVKQRSERHMAAATAIAVQLFQGRKDKVFPSDRNEYERLVMDMGFVLPLAESVGSTCGIKKLVSEYGLLEPNPTQHWKPCAPIKKPFLMKPAQQLIALYMLDIELGGMLEPTPYGFETLTTHMVKCAIAASSTIKDAERPNLQEVLSEIGFCVDSDSTCPTVQKIWEELQQIKVIGSSSSAGEVQGLFHSTRQVQVELHVRKSSGDTPDILVVDKNLFETLKSLKPGDRSAFVSPVTCINYGNSPLADGFVTFYVQRTSDNEKYRFTVMNQSKDYHNRTPLGTKKLNEHAERGKTKLLDALFGEKRLLCVSGSQKVVMSKGPCRMKRAFLPFAVDQSNLLKDLLGKLESQRNVQNRIQKFAFGCNANGDKVDDLSDWL